jgi:trehalose synthase-fused probable maltokinase
VTVAPSLPALGAGDLQDALSGPSRPRLEAALAGFLQHQRWFGSKTATIAAVRIHDSGILGEQDEMAAAIVDVDLEDRRTQRYALPIARVHDDAASELLRTRRRAAIGWLDAPGGPLLADAMSIDRGCRLVGVLLARAGASPLAAGVLQVTIDVEGSKLEVLRSASVIRTGAEQSNSSVIFGGAGILKIYRRLEAGPHPELEMGRYLRAHGFDDVPAVLASIEYVHGADRYALAVLHELVSDATDGWKHALASIREYFARVSGMSATDAPSEGRAGGTPVIPEEPPAGAVRLVGTYLDAARMLGAQTARMHLALARGTGDAFAPEALTASDLTGIVNSARARAERALAHLDAVRRGVPADASERATLLLDQRRRLFECLETDIDPDGAMRMRCHQDYHLGQLLWTGERYALLDFEGEPARSLPERRAKRSPLTDVAGMLRSYSYAAWSGLFAHARAARRDALVDRPWAAAWERAVAGAFIQRYLDEAAGASFLPRDPAARVRLLQVLLLDKAAYELEYELNNRPDWILVPVEGLLALL